VTASLFWLQGQTCGGNTISILNASDPDFCTFLDETGIDLLYHPSLSPLWGRQLMALIRALTSGRRRLDILVFEGAVPLGPQGTGLYCTLDDLPIKDVVLGMAQQARYVVSVGNCASHGGMAALPPNPTGATGLQWEGRRIGGLLGPGFRSRSGLPVINLTGCPVPPHFMVATLRALAEGSLGAGCLDDYHRPRFLYQPLGEGCAHPAPGEAEGHICTGCARPGWPQRPEEVLPFHGPAYG
jgi:Ni,Fe-hydrogenase I small subunit